MPRDLPRVPRTFARTAFTLTLVMCLAPIALAQDSGPMIISQRKPMVFFRLDRLDGSVEAYWRYRLDESDPAIGPTTRDTESLFRESLTISTEGFFGDPNLLKLDLDVSLQLTQEDIDSNSDAERQQTSESINEYNASLLVFQKSSTPLTLYSRRSQVLLDRQFADSLDSINTEHGARLMLHSEIAPSQISYFHREQRQTGRTSGTDFELLQDSIAWQGQITPIGGHRFWWDYTYSSIDERGQIRVPNTFDRHDAFLNHTLAFGDTTQHSLRSSARVYQETGEFPIDRFRWNEILRLQHTKTFETRYDYLFDQQERPDSKQTSHRGTASFRHELYDSLTTTGKVGASRLTLTEDDFESTEQFGNLGVEYRKIVPFGRIVATADFDYSTLDDSERGGSIQITDEVKTFGASGFVTLQRRNIEPGFIVVTDATGVFLYSEGADYTLRVFQDSVEIQRVLGGNIMSGQTVLVDYQIGPEPASTTDTIGLGVTLRYRIQEGWLRGLSPYMRFRDQNQDRTGDDLNSLPQNDIQDLVIGVDYNIWRLALSAEHQRHDGTLSPFDLTRLEARYTQRFGRRDSMLMSLYYQETDRHDENLQSDVLNVTARWNTQVNERLRSGLSGTWRQDHDSEGTDTEAFDLEFDLNWQYRLTSIYCNARTSFLNSSDRDNISETLTIGIRREF